MHNKYVVDATSAGVLKTRYLLLDTNFVIDAHIFTDEVKKLTTQLEGLECELITTRSVITEFLGGAKNEVVLAAKIKLLQVLFDKPLSEIPSLVANKALPNTTDFLNFSRQCNKFAATDFELYITLKQYKPSKLLLVTRNHLDFTNKLFNREGFITLLGSREIRTYGLYSVL